MKKFILWCKENKLFLFISIIFISLLFYTTMNTSLASDDYPYSLFYRGGARITHLSQIVANQISDYMKINGRVFTNGLGQLLLMFDREVFALLNPIIILVTLILLIKLVDLYIPLTKNNKVVLLLLSMGLFFTMDKSKYIVYWVMGAANYVWIFPFLLLFLCYYKQYGLFQKPLLEGTYIGITACFHESLLVFWIIFILVHIGYGYFKEKKVDKRYIHYIIPLIIASIFVFASPGNRLRNSTWYPEWNKLNWIERLSITIPVVAKGMFGFESIHNLIPLIFTILIVFNLFKRKFKYSYILISSLILLYIGGLVLDNGWLYFIFSILLFVSELLLHENSDNKLLTLQSLSYYAIVYSMIITPEYAAGRPNYFMYGYMIFAIMYFIIPILNKKILILFISLFFIVFAVREIYIYKVIGDVINKREEAILDVKKKDLKVLKFEKIPSGYGRYHMEPNAPASEYYWAHDYFCTYYGLPKDIKIK